MQSAMEDNGLGPWDVHMLGSKEDGYECANAESVGSTSSCGGSNSSIMRERNNHLLGLKV